MIRLLVGFFLMAGGIGGIEENADMFPSICFAIAGCLLMLSADFEKLSKD